ncbi:MAG: bifunctional riboflavin kinase/FAD synthetase [Lachnospiraceae bacterium]|nr:bifunctional riboflavin kinase/FAD synthetase [Lachnospiraceae bacterium]
MEIISGTIDFQMEESTAVVIGKFDGLHIGHQLLIDRLLEQKKKGLKAVVFTFDRSPVSLFLCDGDTYRELCTLQEKREIFEAMGVDVLVEFPMNMQTAAISAEEFVTEMLQKQLFCKKLIAGEDITFGYKGLGDSRLLKKYSKDCGYDVEILEKLLVNYVFSEEASGEEISSTVIRKAVNAGNISRANRLMNRAFSVRGEVIHGRQLGGSLLDMPTANVEWPKNKVLPPFGVYFTRVITEDGCYDSITNVGKKPTVASAEEEILSESYLYDFHGDLYGKEIVVEFYEYLRPEQKFESLEALKVQMQKDMSLGRGFWSQKILNRM